MITQTTTRAFALTQFTAPVQPTVPQPVSASFDPARQISLAADGTPSCHHAFDPSRTSNGINTKSELEIMDFC
ncbi:hypothetical protein [Streptomyces sp. NPDC056987]|uniref:hypothetical protein n=1 Tax=Streptomyces sp. NPDC056987 TaxID=3345988 RepID=UPI00362C32E5